MGYETGLTKDDLTHLTSTSRMLDERLNRAPLRNAAYVGESAFAHKGGLHVSAIEKCARACRDLEPATGSYRAHLLLRTHKFPRPAYYSANWLMSQAEWR